MNLIRIATPSTSMNAAVAIILHTDEVKIALARAEVAGKTEAQIEAAIAQIAGVYPLPDIFVHINRDDSIALATGAAPNVWPEDEL